MKMSRFIVALILIISFPVSMYAQETTRIIYQAIPAFNPEAQSSLMGQEMGIQAENIISGFEFELLIQNGKSIFRKVGRIFESDPDDLMYRVALGFSGGDEIWYTEENDPEKILHRLDLEGEVTLNLNEEVDWTIGAETKIIAGYKAIKAKAFRKKASHTEEVEVWYTPELPYTFGPLGYNDLPGLILEMKRFKVTYKFKRIESTNIKLDPPKETERKMSFEDYYRALGNNMQNTIKNGN